MDYKKLYANYYGISWNTEEFDIHHINGNREDNNIRNLILLPKELHQRLHRALYRLMTSLKGAEEIKVETLSVECLTFNGAAIVCDSLYDYLDELESCQNWGALKSAGYNLPCGEHIDTITLDTRFIVWNA